MKMSELGMLIHAFYMADYFESEDLEEALEQMLNDDETVIETKKARLVCQRVQPINK